MSYNHLISKNTSEGYEEMITFSDFEELIGLENYKEIENKFSKK